MNSGKAITNAEIAQILLEMAAYWDMQNVDYKKRAYELAAADVKLYPDDLFLLYKEKGLQGLTNVPSVGPRIAKHIQELLTTGRFKEYEEFKKKIPVNLKELLRLEGVGPRTIRELWFRLKVTNLKELEAACRSGKVRSLPRFGIRSEARILQAIENVKATDTMA